MFAFILALGVFALDRWSKWTIETQFGSYDTKTVIPGFFNLVRSQNPGVAFGIFAETSGRARTPILIGLSVIAVLLLAVMLWRIDRLDTASAAGLALIFGGAMGNVFDRVRAGGVTDFLDFYAGTYHWYTFNVADASICTGAGLLILSMIFSKR
jgi:signal peptidase II